MRWQVGTVSAQKEDEGEKRETRQKVDEDRKPQIEASIVRIMKMRKEMEHNALISEARDTPEIGACRDLRGARCTRDRRVQRQAAEAGACELTPSRRAQVTSQLSSRFIPHPTVVKKRIESLIEREFLERDKNNFRKYNYLA